MKYKVSEKMLCFIRTEGMRRSCYKDQNRGDTDNG